MADEAIMALEDERQKAAGGHSAVDELMAAMQEKERENAGLPAEEGEETTDKSSDKPEESSDKPEGSQGGEDGGEKPKENTGEDEGKPDDNPPGVGDLLSPVIEQGKPEEGQEEQPADSDDEAAKEAKEILDDPTKSKREKKSVQRLLDKIDHERSEKDKLTAEKDKEIEALKAQLESKPEPTADPVSDEERKELLMLRRRFEAERDDELVKPFNDRIAATEQEIESILSTIMPAEKTYKTVEDDMGESKRVEIASLENVKNAGGFAKYAEAYPDTYKAIIDSLPPHSASILQGLYADQVVQERQKALRIQEESGKAEEYFKQRDEQLSQQNAKTEEEMKALQAAKDAAIDQMIDKSDFMKVPEGADETTALKVKNMQDLFRMAAEPQSEEEKIQVAIFNMNK